jgi:magnesium chelatase family protein
MTSTLVRWLATILPTVTLAETIETTRIHSIAGLTGGHTAFVTARPRSAPTHLQIRRAPPAYSTV